MNFSAWARHSLRTSTLLSRFFFSRPRLFSTWSSMGSP